MKRLSPLAEVVRQSLRREILQGTHPAGKPLVSERTLADRHSVSRTVVREAVGALAEEGLILLSERCRPVVAHAPSRRPRVDSARIGVWLWPYLEDTIASAILRGIQRAARGTEARFIINAAPHASWEDDVEAEARFLRGLRDDGVDGAILWYLGGNRNLPFLREARNAGIDFVFVDRRPPTGFDADFVGTENVGSARKATQHLLDLGHRRIAYVGNLDTASPVQERRAGFRRALDEAGLRPAGELVFAPEEGETEESAAHRTAEAMRALSPEPTAFFAVNDSVALVLIEALRKLGTDVPKDLSVVGFDGRLHWLPGGGPLTTAKQDFTTIGEMAGDMLFKRFAADSPSTYCHVLLDAPLSLGGSTAARKPGPDASTLTRQP